MKRHLREILSGILSPEGTANVYNSYDIVGDIAIIRLTENSKKCVSAVAEAVMKVHRNVNAVFAQTSPVEGDFRLRKLEHVAGENRTTTCHRESRCLFAVDVDKCYFSPRLFYERIRITGLVKPREVIVNMFAGVGSFSILIAKNSNAERIYSIDVNHVAVQCMRENVRINGVYGKVIPMLGDAKKVIEERLRHVADRILMPLPERALEYLPCAVLALKKSGGWIHYYDFEHATKNEDPIEKVKLRVAERLAKLNASFEFPLCRVIRTTGPNWHQIVLDIKMNFGTDVSGLPNSLDV